MNKASIYQKYFSLFFVVTVSWHKLNRRDATIRL
nr:MAG TPA: hypothetical protein [Caudoviricetes sp.]